MRFGAVIVLAIGSAIVLGAAASTADAASKKKNLTEAQKKQMRDKAREYCTKHYVKGGNARLGRVYIRQDGRVMCEVWS